ncbi:hypothetical protein FB451DRAFT_1402078 [Mycena latifolia]|nr:hypothetical protein FB451DRAFT_1402078 [Mycena latifolia]
MSSASRTRSAPSTSAGSASTPAAITTTSIRHRLSRQNNLELGSFRTKPGEIYIQTQVSTHVSPSFGKEHAIEANILISDGL